MADTPSTQGSQEQDPFSFNSSTESDFPLCPEGPANVKVVRALFQWKKKNPKFLKAGEDPNKEFPHISLMLQTDKTYDFEGVKKPHNIFYGFKVSDHPSSTMLPFFRSTMGIDVPLKEVKETKNGVEKIVKKIDLQKPVEVMDEKSKMAQLHMRQFEGLDFGIIVKNEKGDDGEIRDRVDSVFASSDQKALNAQLFLAPAA